MRKRCVLCATVQEIQMTTYFSCVLALGTYGKLSSCKVILTYLVWGWDNIVSQSAMMFKGKKDKSCYRQGLPFISFGGKEISGSLRVKEGMWRMSLGLFVRKSGSGCSALNSRIVWGFVKPWKKGDYPWIVSGG